MKKASNNRSAELPIVERPPIREGSVSLQYPMLSRNNYMSWTIKVKVYMEAQGIWDVVEPVDGEVVDPQRDKMALAAIYQGIPEDMLLAIAEKRTTKEAWLTLKNMHLGADRVKSAKVQTLRSEFEILHMKETESLDDFAMKLTNIVNQIRSLGEHIEEMYGVKKFLRAVCRKFLPIVSTIEQFGNVDVMPLDEAIGWLKAYEERMRTAVDTEGEQLLLTHSEWVSRMNKNERVQPTHSKGRGVGNGRGRFRGHGRGNGQGGGRGVHMLR